MRINDPDDEFNYDEYADDKAERNIRYKRLV